MILRMIQGILLIRFSILNSGMRGSDFIDSLMKSILQSEVVVSDTNS